MESLGLFMSPKIEIVQINGKNYPLEYKPRGTPVGQDVYNFVLTEWSRPQSESSIKLHKALSIRELDLLRNEKKEIIALCSYGVREVHMVDDGEIALTLVRQDYATRNSIGYFLTKRVVDKIVMSAENGSDFIPPVEIVVQAGTRKGAMLIKKLEEEYRGRVKFDVDEM